VKKRLRKKLHVGEFQELGFEVCFRVADNLSHDAFHTVVDVLISEAIEAHGLVCGGGGKNPEWTVFVTREGRGSGTEEHRQAIATWLAARPEVSTVQIGPLVDAWYPI
jgi:uncharacterized protein YggL (DUF469 family)